jgi:hypothetical protein
MRQFFKHFVNARRKSHQLKIVLSLLFAEPVTGFFFGVVKCADCGFNPFSYLFMGALYSFLSTITLGGRFGSSYFDGVNLWPYVPYSALFIWLVLWIVDYGMAKPNLAVERDAAKARRPSP